MSQTVKECAVSFVAAFVLGGLAMWLTSCGPVAQQHRARIEAAEDKLCEIRAAQKSFEGQPSK